MKVYKLAVPDRTTVLIGADDRSVDAMADAGRGIAADWPTVRVRVDATFVDRRLGPQDMPWVNSGSLAIPMKNNAFVDIMSQHGTLLPVSGTRVPTSIFVATDIVPGALSRSSRVELIPGSSRVLEVLDWQFESETILDKWFFRVPEIPEYLLLGDKGADAIRASKLNGPHLVEIWAS